MRASVLFNIFALTGLSLAAPADKKRSDTAAQITNAIYWGPIENSLQSLLDQASPPETVVFSAADLGNGTMFPSSHPGLPLTAEEEQARAHIIGADDRVEVDSSAYPWSTVGRLTGSHGGLCSGALVGPRLVSVARHCIDAPAGTTFSFAPNYRDGPRYGQSDVQLIAYLAVDDYLTNNCNRKYDWALLVLNDALGTRQGWLGSAVWTAFGIEGQPVLNSAAYHGDKAMNTMWFHGGVTSMKWQFGECGNYGPLQSDTDGTSGSSGSAIWVYDGTNRFNLGALSGGTGDWTIHGWGEEMVNAVIDLNNKYPA